MSITKFLIIYLLIPSNEKYMNSKHKLFALLCLILFVTGITKAQVYNQNDPKWDQTPSTALYPLGNYVALPQQVLPVQRSMTPRVIKTPNEVLDIFPNIQVLPSPGVLQIETPIVTSRVNPLFMFGSCNIIQSGQINAGSFTTTNGGVNWFGSNYINNGNAANQRSDPGPAIDKNQTIIFTHITSSSNFGAITGMGAEWSTNFGANFSPTVQIEYNTNVDKNLAATDDNPGSPYYVNTYVAYTVFSGSLANGHFNRTTDGGLTWGTAYQINTTPSPYFAQGHDVDVRPNGDVIVCWTVAQQTNPYTEHYVGVAKSTDGGVSFNPSNVQEEAYAVNGTRSFAFNGWSNFRINGFPRISIDKSGGPRNGWIYIVDDQVNMSPAGSDADVIMHRSTDGGATWSAGIRVNQDTLNNGKVQFFPCINVDANGGVNVAYYDNRNFPSVGDSCSVFISRSLDGGNTWVDAEVADHHYKPKQPPGVGGGFDYMGVTSANGKIWAFWSDDKSGTFNAWAGYITATPLGINHQSNQIPKTYSLAQNFPNPFNPTTLIKYGIPKQGLVTIVVYDILGKEVSTLINEVKQAGTYEINFNASNLTSGVYFYKITTNDFTDVKKMMLIK
jgi:hypothetical protein